MKLLFLMFVFPLTIAGYVQSTRRTDTPVQILYGERTANKRGRGPLFSGVLNMKILNDALPEYPQKAKDENIQGRVEIELLINEEGEVIFANPLSGPEELWAESVRAAVGALFRPAAVEGEPVKIAGRVIFDFKNGKVELPYRIRVTG